MANKSYTYELTWQHLAGASPDVKLVDEVQATSVPRAVSKLLKDLSDSGYERRDVLVIEARNMDNWSLRGKT